MSLLEKIKSPFTKIAVSVLGTLGLYKLPADDYNLTQEVQEETVTPRKAQILPNTQHVASSAITEGDWDDLVKTFSETRANRGTPNDDVRSRPRVITRDQGT